MRMHHDHPYLIEVETNVFSIPQRVKAYNKDLFVVWNAKHERFEIHNHANRGTTFCFAVPYKELDCRVLELIRKGDVRNRGDSIYKEMHEHNRKLEEQNERERKHWIDTAVKESRPYFQKAYDESRGV